MQRVLYISMLTPFKEIANAGGKTFYYYMDTISKEKDLEISAICKKTDADTLPGNELGTVNFTFVSNPGSYNVKQIWKLLLDINAKINPFCKYGNTLRWTIYEGIINTCRAMREAPDVVVLEFTQMVLLAPEIKKIFPGARIIASEHDVTFLGLERKFRGEKNVLKKAYKYLQYRNIKQRELSALDQCNTIMPHNIKDKRLLMANGVPENKIWTLTPYYMSNDVSRKCTGKDVIFYGAMGRDENEEAAIWFIRNVLPLMNSNLGIRFVVLGANPSSRMRAYESDQVHVTGFVDSPLDYLRECLCVVAPLHYGAGIKVKVLECFALGVPVLTGEVGIEGIPAQNGRDYFHCETPQEYKKALEILLTKSDSLHTMEQNEKALMKRYFDLSTAGMQYVQVIKGEKLNDSE